MAMDYETPRGTDNEPNTNELVPEIAAIAAAAAQAGATPLVPGPDNVIVLPAGVTLDDIEVQGRDLVITLDNGQVYVIPEGAIYVPQIVVDGVAVPPMNLAALLNGIEGIEGENFTPEAGPTRSSGGNFADPVNPIGPAFGLGDLLPYTELAFPQQPPRDIIPGRINRPVNLALTPGNNSVDESGLPARGAEPAGSNSAANSETTTGTVNVNAPDGLASLTINGTAITAVGQTIVTARGTMTITAINPATQSYSYSYTLADNTSGDNTSDPFTVIATDTDGDTATGVIDIRIIDDVPTARNDTDAVAAGTYGPESGNVFTGAGTTSGAAGADTPGADGATVTGFRGGNSGAFSAAGATVVGTYGTLTFNANGTYTYTRNAGTPGGVNDVFSYQVTDGDGDTSTATLTISIGDATPQTAANAVVLLDDDALAGGNPGGTGDDVNSANSTGTLGASGGDGPLVWSLSTAGAPAGFSYVANGTGIDVFQGATKVLAITLNTATGAYTVTQVAPIVHAAGSDENNQGFTLSYQVRDQDGDTASGNLSINVDDDTPVTANDTDTIASGTYGPATGNVLTDASAGDAGDGDTGADSVGADGGLAVTAITGAAAGTVGGTTAGAYGVLTLNADGSYTYTRNAGTPGGVNDVFTYTVTDADGDTATATLTIAIADALPLTGQNAQVQLDDDAQAGGNPGGTGDDPDAVNVAGTLAGSGGDGPLTWQMTSFTSPIGFSVTLVNQGLLEIFQGATKVFSITLNTATGAYTVTQHAAIDQSALGDENNSNFTLGYRVTDQDGDIAGGSLSITIDDDTPVVADDTDSLLLGATGPATGNVLTDASAGDAGDSDTGADSLGADGGSVTRIDSVNVPANFDDTPDGSSNFTVAGQYGTLTINADGSYSYTRNNGAPLDAVDVFSYTVTDGDGDTATATLSITIQDAGPVTGKNATVLLDDDALAGGNPGGTGDDVDSANATGFLAGSGGDGALTWTMTSFTSPIGFSVTLVNSSLLEVFQGATKVFSITLNNATGAYTVVQHAAIDHTALLDENNTQFTLGYRVTDADGDIAGGSIGINIDDDTPVLANDTDELLAGFTGPATGNVLTDAAAGDAGDGDAGADSLGADGGTVTRIDSVNVPANFDDTADGTGNFVVAGQYGTLTINADGSYSYTRNNGAPLNAVDTFQYTVTDGDGDTATATLAITIQDAGPVTGQNATVLLDDDALAGGNPGGTGDDVDSANATGFLAGSGGDGALTWTMSSFTSPIGFSVTLVNSSLLEIFQGATKVFTITLNNATGAYTVTQIAPIDHSAGLDENNTQFTLGYRVTDADGDIAGGSIAINIDDDTPVLANDTDELLAGFTGPATGNVLTDAAAGDAGDSDTGADSLGADGGSVTRIDSVNVPANFDDTLDASDNLTVAGQYGTLTINADGSYSYTRNNGAPLNAVDTFTYTVTDGDGDTATATLTITIQDAGPVTGQNAAVQLDDDALAGGNPGGTGDDPDSVNASGFLAGSGGDGVLTWNMSSFTSPIGFSVTLVNAGLLEIFQGATKVFSITLDNATGAYTVTQVAPIDHSAGLDENNTGFTLGYRVTDADGDIAGGTLSINIDDDTPVLANDLDTVSAGSFDPATGNVLTDAAAGDAGDADTGADSLGADGGKLTGIASDNVPANFDTTADGSGNFTVAGQYGVLTINEDGSYSYVRNAGTVGGVSDVFTYTVTDGDGDTAEATLTIEIADARPVVGPNALVQLDDDAQPGGNPGGTGDDPDAVNVTGTLSGSGGDGALTWQMTSFTSPAGFNVTLVNQGLLQITQGGTLVMTITLNTATGAYTVTQNAPIDHSALGDENNAGFSLGYRVFDADGDQAFGSIAINIDDDTPVVSNDTDSVAIGTYGPVTGNVITDAAPGDAGDSDTGADSLGADGAAAAGPVTAITGFGGAGTIGGTTTGQYGVLTINADGSYSYTRNAGTPGGVTDTFTYTVTDGDGDTAQATLTIDIADAPVLIGVNLLVQLDDDALAGGNPGGTGDDFNSVNATGFLGAGGGDGPLSWALNTTGAPAGFSYVANGTGLDVFQGATKVLAITLNTATGAYTVTQVAAIDHVAGLDENNQAFAFTYTVTDQDGDSATGNWAINVDDDTPVAANDTDLVGAGTYGPVVGNVMTGAGSDGNAAGADGIGADGAAVGGPVTAISGSGGSGTIGGTTTGTYGVLTLNADGSYSYTRDAGTPGGVSDVFTYTITDGDGDTATATLTITIADARPVTGVNALVQLDDDALAGGNPGGTGDDVDAANLTGTLAGSGGDGPLSWDMVSFTSPGATFTPTLVNPGLLELRQNGTLVYTITLNNSTGAYTVTQVAPIDHSAGGDENNFSFALGYRVTDQDGDTAFGSLSINVDDDTPVLANDTDTILSGTYGPATGNVLTDASAGDAGDTDTGADSAGADGGLTVTAISGFGGAGAIAGTTTGQYGVLTMNADGSYSYTRNAGTPGGVSDTFTYTATDADGDSATATLVITIADANPITGANAVVLLDDDALAGGNPGGTGDDADAVNVTGTLAGSGGDGPLTWDMVSFTSPGGTFNATLVNPTLVEVRQSGTLVFTITLNNSTGAYTVTQVAPIDHTAAGDENNFSFSLGYRVVDQDGDQAFGSLGINIDDDTPTVASNAIVQLDDDALGGNPGGAGDDVNTANAVGVLSHSYGADVPGSVILLTTGAPAGFTYVANGTGLDVFQGAVKVLAVTLNTATGAYTVTQVAPIEHATGNDENNQLFTLNYVVTDGDGDIANGTLQINVDDDTPTALVASFSATVDEDGLAGGNPGGTGDAAATLANAAGTVTGLFSAGADTPLSYSLNASTASLPSLTSGGVALTYSVAGNVLTAKAGATTVFTFTLNATTGNWDFVLSAPLDHSAAGTEDDILINLGEMIFATDNDGDSVQAVGDLIVTVDDDTPVAANDTDSVASGTYGPVTGNILTDASAGDAGDSDTGADSMGADGGSLTAITGFGGAGTIGGTTTGQYGVLTLNPDGSYSYTRNAGTPGGVSDVFTYTITDGDGDTATATLTISIADATPVTAANAQVQFDDDALAGGNAGGTGDDPDAVNLTGTLAGSGGDGPLSWSMISFTSPGGTFTASLITPSLLEIRQSGTLVFTITLNNSTGAYTVTQVAPIDHSAGGDENNFTFSLGYRVTDQDGDIANGTLSISVDDDTPVLANDIDTIAAGTFGPATGNVITDAAAGDAGDTDTGADSLGADGAATGGAVTAITGFGGAGTIGGTTTGQYGVLTMNADGSYSYTRNAGTPGGVSDVFTYTATDGDGDSATATLTIQIADAIPLVPGNAEIVMDDDTLAGGNAGGVGDDTPANLTGFLAGSGGDGQLIWSMTSFTSPGVTFTPTLVTPSLLEIRQNGTLVYTITLNNLTGAYVATQVAPIQHLAGFDENNFFFTLGYTVTDADGDIVGGSISITVDDDTPVLANDTDSLPGGSNGPATGNVLTDAAPGDAGDTDTGADSLGADGGSVTAITGFGGAGTVGGTTNGQYGVLTLNSDGSYSYTRNSGTPGNVSDVFTYTVTDGDGDTATATLTITISDAAPVTTTNLTVLLDDDALAGGIAGGTGDDVNAANTTGTLSGSGGDGALTWAMQTTGAPAGFTYVANGTGIDVFQGATKVLAVTLNAATGAYTVTQVAAIQHAAGGDENNQAFTLNYSVTDTDGDSAAGTLAINVDDDSAIAVAAKSTTMNNAIGATGGNFLDADNDVDNNYGADGAGKVFFTAATITSLQGQNLTSGLVSLNYALSAGDTVLTATRSDNNSVVFTVKLQPAGSADQYTVDIAQKLDATAQVDFNSGGYNFVGGNGSWAAFTNPIVGSQDILLTPMTGGVDSGTVNANANEGGVSSGGSVGQNESMRVDFVIDVTGAPNSGADYAVLANQNHSFTGHYTANGANALITGISPGKSTTVIITARDDIDNDNDVGDGVLDTINKVSITHGAVTTLITTSGVYVVDGISYTVTFSGGLATISGVVDQTRLGAFTATGYNSIEFGHNNLADNTNTNQPFKVGDFGATTITNSPVSFNVPISIQDSDGDTVSSGNIAVTLNPTAPPVVLDLNGDGVNFLSTDAGVGYDYGAGLVTTAWVAADDGILAIDGNGDGSISASEMVFGSSAATDLQGLAASHDSNADGVLDASDADFASFGVWQDADSDGVTDAGEFRSLTDLGITSISLASDGEGYTTADGDVIVNGQAVYTRADGTTGTVADAAFAIIEQARQAARTTELAGVAAATGGFLATTAMAAAMPAADDSQAAVAGIELHGPQAEAVDADLAPAADGFEFDSAGSQPIHDQAAQLETAGHDWADGMADALARIDMGALTDRIAEMAGSDGNADRFAAIADAIGSQFSIGSGSLEAVFAQDLPAFEAAMADVAGADLVDALVDHFAANDAGPGHWVAPASDFALQGLLDTAVGDAPQMNFSGADLARMMFNSTELADTSHG